MRQSTIARRKVRRTGSLRARTWWLLRKNKCMTLLEIQNIICDGSEKNATANLRRWLIKLVAVGVLDTEQANNGGSRYKLVIDIGPAAPIVRAGGEVFNSNTKTVINPKQGGTTDAVINCI
ncbi:hypothetical protein [Methylobacter sp. S3L5C]|uniref:hypothetical protein n=1 Tax=Methylobacter sp. S3L5C TaxID=2839024 RepID=UPI001FACE18D|nr:hypothetical protein [Methylobacter sp. S3L5C]UOA07811.1 hypothetical protein KKZ03_16360 [Methylobacter sp. S3L5C]